MHYITKLPFPPPQSQDIERLFFSYHYNTNTHWHPQTPDSSVT